MGAGVSMHLDFIILYKTEAKLLYIYYILLMSVWNKAIATILCPVASLLNCLDAWGGAPGPLFICQDGTPLCRKWFVANVQQALSAARVPGASFNVHSFQIGANTTASAATVPEITIKSWQVASMAYQRYIRLPADELARIAPHAAHITSFSQWHGA